MTIGSSVLSSGVKSSLFFTTSTLALMPSLASVSRVTDRLRRDHHLVTAYWQRSECVNRRPPLNGEVRLEQARVRVVVQLYSLFNLGARWGCVVNLTSRPLSKSTRYQLYRRLGGPQGLTGWVRTILPQPGFDPRTVQPVACRYSDWATGPGLNGVLVN